MDFRVQGNLQVSAAFSELRSFFNKGKKLDSTDFRVKSCKILTVMI